MRKEKVKEIGRSEGGKGMMRESGRSEGVEGVVRKEDGGNWEG